METGRTAYVTTPQLARTFGLDARTVARRLTAAGLTPDADLCESTGRLSLWRMTAARARELHAAISRPDDLGPDYLAIMRGDVVRITNAQVIKE